MHARRAIVRWALRTYRREWRQQLLVLVLLAIVATASVYVTTMAYNIASTRHDVFGDATHRYRFDVEDPLALEAFAGDVAAHFDTFEILEHESVRVPGATVPVELRTFGDRSLSAPMVDVLDGRLPATGDEIAVTDGVAALFDAGVGDRVDLGDERTVVGLIENPGELSDEHAVVTDVEPQVLTVLVRSDADGVRAFRSPNEPGGGFLEERGQQEKTTAAVVALVMTTVAMLLVGLVAAAGFVVVAHRRQRQLGLLGAMGASRRHLRLVMLANGAAVGGVAAVTGTVLALVAWRATSGFFDATAGHRIPAFDVPWAMVATGGALAVAASTFAAWWPARVVSRIPVVRALSGRPPDARPARRTAAAAVVLAAGGLAAVAMGNDVAADDSTEPLLLAGVVAVVAAVVLSASPAIRALGLVAARLPLPVRLAVRDLSRHRARAGAALASASLGLGIAMAIAIGAAAAEHGEGEGNLGEHQLLVFAGPRGDVVDPVLEVTERDRAAFESIVAELDGPSVLPLHAVTDDEGHPVVLARPVGEKTLRDAGPVYAATSEALRHLGVASVDPDALVLTPQQGPVYLVGEIEETRYRRNPVPDEQVQRIDAPRYDHAPRTLLTDAALERTGWRATPMGWLVEVSRPWEPGELARLRARAADVDLVIGTRDEQPGLQTLRTIASAAGALLALAILAMSVGLLRGEATADLRTLAATGATRRTRRSITASTAGTLAVLAVLLGTSLAYLAIVAGYRTDLGRMGAPPFAHLGAVALGLPLVATVTSWLLGGRERAP